MSKLLAWRDEWSLNIDVLDKDHRALIERLGDICMRFCPEASAGRSGDALALLDALNELGEEVRRHFQREEDFMRAYDYEGIGEHRSEHALLMAEFTTLMREWRAEGLHVFDRTVQSIVSDWLLAHILGADREFAEVYFQLCGRDVSLDEHRSMTQLQSSYRSGLKSASTK
ncbi:bacteriohemerythrin [Imhoffiella purpurea]|uniref:Hemerythrin family protein n=1 Tax=Imhoffiella purpurea TaxID=1249627 RepID=W9VCY2_9GAMM|nr:hemerythrin domain-containing protein [Imhoffiella purpurea]EXJ13897.1 hemerythrin family protein [Imhoffiella purpurea]